MTAQKVGMTIATLHKIRTQADVLLADFSTLPHAHPMIEMIKKLTEELESAAVASEK